MNRHTRSAIFWLVTIAVFVAINWQIAEKEATLRDGRTMLLRLAPVDPRSLIQGDYMRLRYEMAGSDEVEAAIGESLDGRIVVALDERGVATFVRAYDGGPLAPGEALLRYRNRGEVQFGAESFFFEEGQASVFERAKYGELKVDDEGTSILVGLRDENLVLLGRS